MIKFKMGISAETAIRNGRANIGWKEIELDDAFVSSLSEAQREELLCCLSAGTETPTKDGKRFTVSDTTEDALREYLSKRVLLNIALREEEQRRSLEREASQREEGRKRAQHHIDMPLDAWSLDYRGEVVNIQVPEGLQHAYNVRRDAAIAMHRQRALDAAAYAAQKKEIEEHNARQISVWVKSNGTPSMIEREAEGLLPEAELLAAVREQLFTPFNGLPRYVRLTDRDVSHSKEDCESRCYFTADDIDELTEEEFAVLGYLRKIVEATAESPRFPPFKLCPMEHRGGCKEPGCDRLTLRRSVNVSTVWFGNGLSREYALTVPGQEAYWGA